MTPWLVDRAPHRSPAGDTAGDTPVNPPRGGGISYSIRKSERRDMDIFLIIAAVIFAADALWHKSLVAAGLFFFVLSMLV